MAEEVMNSMNYTGSETKPKISVRTPLLSEVLAKVHSAKTKPQKVKILKENDSPALRQICKWSFDPKIVSALPEGAPPYIVNEAPEGTEHELLRRIGDKLYRFCKGGDDSLQQTRREQLFVQILESLHKDEAELLINTKDKKLHQIYKGFSHAVVKEAFGWNDDYVQV